MMGRSLTALVDGELPVHRAAAVRAHLKECADCAERHRAIESTVPRQRQLLQQAVAPVEVTVGPMLRRVTERIADDPAVQRPWFLQPATLAAAVAVLVLVAFFGLLEPVFIAVGLQNPPEVVADQAEMFRDYALFEYLEALEHYDAVSSTPVMKPANNLPHG